MNKIKNLLCTSSMACFEIINNCCYNSETPYHVLLDKKIVYENKTENIFSLYGLEPAKTYELIIESSAFKAPVQFNFITKEESLCLKSSTFGAKGDGTVDNTQALQTAIMACPPQGRVLIEPGTYYVHPLFLKSRITLELKKGAVLIAFSERDKYPVLPAIDLKDMIRPACKTSGKPSGLFHVLHDGMLGSWEGEPAPVFASLFTGFHLEDFALIGEGTVDGNGNMGDWWIEPKVKRTAWRPKLIFFAHCKNIIIQGVTLKNSPSWTVHPFFSDHLDFYDLSIINPKDSPNTDGINPESCQNVNIVGCSISVGDDCIAVKSGKLIPDVRFLRTTKNIAIRNCLMKFGHGAVTLGSEMSGGIRELHVSQCLFISTDRGLRIKTRRGRGKDGIIDRITFENIKMKGVLTPFVINMFYHCDIDGKEEYVWSKNKLPLDERTPRLGKVVFKKIICEDCEVAALFFYGLPEQKIGYVYLENIRVSFANKAEKGNPAMMSFIEPVSKMGMYINQAKKVVIKDVTVKGHNGDSYIFNNIDNLKMM